MYILTNVEVFPATPDRWADVEELFGARGACGGCWCMAWRLSASAFEAGKGAPNHDALRALVQSGAEPGLLAYAGDRPAGWIALAPREQYVRLERSKTLKRIDDEPVWSISCLFVAKPFRRQGVSVDLLRAACAYAASRGARIVEGYPTEPDGALPDPFVWTGLASAFRRAGFTEVVRRSRTRPIMRAFV